MAIPKNYPDTSTPLTAEFLLNYCHPVGEVFFTEDDTFDPNVEWGGTWKLDEDGVVYASKSSTNESPFNVDVGTIIGEDSHNLNESELPNIQGSFNIHGQENGTIFYTKSGKTTGVLIDGKYKTITSSEQGAYSYGDIGFNFGGNQPHNNIQRTKICNIWIRIA